MTALARAHQCPISVPSRPISVPSRMRRSSSSALPGNFGKVAEGQSRPDALAALAGRADQRGAKLIAPVLQKVLIERPGIAHSRPGQRDLPLGRQPPQAQARCARSPEWRQARSHQRTNARRHAGRWRRWCATRPSVRGPRAGSSGQARAEGKNGLSHRRKTDCPAIPSPAAKRLEPSWNSEPTGWTRKDSSVRKEADHADVRSAARDPG